MYKILAAFIIFAILIFLAFTGTDAFAQKTEIKPQMVDNVPSECGQSTVWECRRCDRSGNITKGDGGCLCKFCIGGMDGKTVEKDFDLKGIYCFDKKTRLRLLIDQHKTYAGAWR